MISIVPLDNGTLDILSKLEKDGGFDGSPREKRAAHAAGSWLWEAGKKCARKAVQVGEVSVARVTRRNTFACKTDRWSVISDTI